ncbi:MAG TPA: NAD-dependent succinate-semialdehyde dehydrogenase, partial [Actinomycetota bacterium]|nr:NAD-dependent succinate-semialdehyde dehydrogenase [Actinomycetota bacterium]
MTTSSHERQVLDEVVTPQLHIGSEWREASGGASFPVEDPATGEVLCQVADATGDDAVAALDAACQAQDPWAEHPPRERGEILRRAWQLITDRRDDLALLMTMEMGKPLGESRAEVSYGAEFLRWFSEEAVRIDGRWSRDPSGSGRLLTMKQPVGPCLLITPWNFPLAMGTRKVGPAIAAGCTMVLKPAQLTPLSMLALTRIFDEAGLPPGVLNVIPSASAGRTAGAVMADHRLRKVSFTGSTPVGRTLMGQASENLLRMSMELGGNAPFLVFEDADLDRAVDGAVIAKMRNIGESCVAANRFHVAEPIADEFAARLATRMGALRMGRGTEPEVEVGPLIDEDQRTKVRELVDDAVGRGGKVLVGGGRSDGAGYFFEPTVIGAVPDEARILSEEVFGPVAPVTGFSTEDEALARANGS